MSTPAESPHDYLQHDQRQEKTTLKMSRLTESGVQSFWECCLQKPLCLRHLSMKILLSFSQKVKNKKLSWQKQRPTEIQQYLIVFQTISVVVIVLIFRIYFVNWNKFWKRKDYRQHLCVWIQSTNLCINSDHLQGSSPQKDTEVQAWYVKISHLQGFQYLIQ